MEADTDEFPLGKIMRWVCGVGGGLVLAGIAFLWLAFD
jgi:hypothetical protein